MVTVDKNQELLKLQQEVIATIANENLSLITGQEENYKPHFTCWVKEKNDGVDGIDVQQQELARKYSTKMRGFIIPCKIAIGNCGSIGQINRLETTAN